MSNFAFQILYPIWICIVFNLVMTVVHAAMPWRGPVAAWYFDHNGGLKIMIAGWAIFLLWSIINGIRASS